jgi:hypothetical protein
VVAKEEAAALAEQRKAEQRKMDEATVRHTELELEAAQLTD